MMAFAGLGTGQSPTPSPPGRSVSTHPPHPADTTVRPVPTELLTHPLLENASFGQSEQDQLRHEFDSRAKQNYMDLACFTDFMETVAGADPRYCSHYFVAFDRERTGVLSFNAFAVGMAAMQPAVENDDERLRYVFRMYAEPESGRSAATIGFGQFINMVRHIHRHLGHAADQSSVQAAAAAVFIQSGLEKETGFITESVFVSASLNEGFVGTEGLFRTNRDIFNHGKLVLAGKVPEKDLEELKLSGSPPDGNYARMNTELTQARRASSMEPVTIPAPDFASADAPRKCSEGFKSAPAPVRGTPEAAEAGPVARLSPQKTFRVKMMETAIFDRHRHGGHKEATSRKITQYDLLRQQADPTAAYPEGTMNIVNRILLEVLHEAYRLEPTQVFGFPPFKLTSREEILQIMAVTQDLVLQDAMLVEVLAPVRVYGDIHGQMPDLLHFFHTYGMPNTNPGDIELVNYVFIGDFVDRGSYSLEVLATLFCLKLRFPTRVFLIRGNHEDSEVNQFFGFQLECRSRLVDGDEIWKAANTVFDNLPVAALIEGAIFCVHGGIGKTLKSLDQIREIPRPLKAPVRGAYRDLMRDILWSDPTDHDGVTGIQGNLRGEDMVEFGPDRVMEFIRANGLDLIIRAHQASLKSDGNHHLWP